MTKQTKDAISTALRMAMNRLRNQSGISDLSDKMNWDVYEHCKLALELLQKEEVQG